MTRTTFFLKTLLLGLLGLLGSSSAEEAPKNVMITSSGDPRFAWAPEDGCKPGASHTFGCPLKMDCFPHASFKNGGYCDCNPLFFNTQRKLPFDDSEWDDGLDTKDCVTWNFSKFSTGVFMLMTIIWGLALVHTNILVGRELGKNKALKLNATSYALFFTLWGAVSNVLVFAIYLLNTWDMEPEYFYNRRAYLFVFGNTVAVLPADAEIGCTWLDLVDRTQKMSKSSSRGIKILRWVIRFVGLGVTVTLMYGILSRNIFLLLFTGVGPSAVSMIFIAVAGALIVRTICPDLKDSSNPNWKVAMSIIRTTKFSVLAKIIEIIGLMGMAATNKKPYLAYSYMMFNLLYFWSNLFRYWAYMSYIITGNRKHLKKYESEVVSGFFGLSTIGLNKTVTRASSALSSRASSMAGPSTVEK